MKQEDVDKEIKNITREAECLLEQLSTDRDKQEQVATKRPNASSEITLAAESQSDAEESPDKSDQPINADLNNLVIAIGSLAGLLFLVALIIPLANQLGTSMSNSLITPSDDITGLTKLENDSKNAVLICELRPIIEKAKSLSLGDQALISRKNKIVSDTNKSIAFLDAGSAKGHKYWEDPSCTWGMQWFDENGQNSFRAFVALSKKCTNPKLSYEYTRDKEGKSLIRKGSLSLAGHRIGEITIPYPVEDFAYALIRNVSCG